MKIYATGMNPADCNALKRSPRVAIFQAFVEMMNVVKMQGDQVTWQVTKVGDDLPRDCDAVIVSVLLPRSLNSPYALGAMWAMAQALERNIPLVLYLTDWQFFNVAREFQSIQRAGQDYFSKQIGGSLQYAEDPDKIAQHGESLLNICGSYGNPHSLLMQKAQILVPRFTNWGDVSIVQQMIPGFNPVFSMDPTPRFFQYLTGANSVPNRLPFAEKHRAWLLPSLLNNTVWIEQQELTWRVDQFGPKGFPVVDNERIVQLLYQQRWGALCPPYPTEGSGWWRSRWIHSAIASSLLLCNTKDALAIGHEFLPNGEEYENMTPDQRQLTAGDQSYRMFELCQLDLGLMVDQIYAPFRKAGA